MIWCSFLFVLSWSYFCDLPCFFFFFFFFFADIYCSFLSFKLITPISFACLLACLPFYHH
ncbi:hypothetical protein DFP73DRAFT_538265 [Morchella snyderi]|nr:hypothetical protein DFP73DRAFT_538265 [Morchella snyderi]